MNCHYPASGDASARRRCGAGSLFATKSRGGTWLEPQSRVSMNAGAVPDGLKRGERGVVPSGRTAATRVTVGLLLIGLWSAAFWLIAPLASEQPLMQAAVAYPLSFAAGWTMWSAAAQDAGLIACVGSALIAVASLMRRTSSKLGVRARRV